MSRDARLQEVATLLSGIRHDIDKRNKRLYGTSTQLEQLTEQVAHQTQQLAPQSVPRPVPQPAAPPPPPKKRRILKRLPLLNDHTQYSTWDSTLRASLNEHGLCEYIDENVPEPKDETERQRWLDDRYDISRLMMASIRGQTDLIERMKKHGWVPENEDPKALFCIISLSLFHIDLPSGGEFFKLRQDWTTLDEYYRRVRSFGEWLAASSVIINPEAKFYWVLIPLKEKEKYLSLYERLDAEIKAKTLTWDSLVQDLAEEAETEQIRSLTDFVLAGTPQW
jgi:hypothetical protein